MLRLAVVFCSALLLASCQRETAVERANREKILLVGNGDDPKSLDPHLVTGVIEHNVIRSLLEGLVADDAEKDDAYPSGAAETWEHNADFTEWTFHLRRDATWSDGVPLTARDFEFAYHRNLHPDLAAPYAEMLYFIKNAEAYNKGEIKDFSDVGVAAPDDYTLKLTLREPVPYLPGITRHYSWFPIPQHVVLKFGKMTDRFTKWCEPGNMVGNGPFVLKEWKFNRHLEVSKNPRYWNAANVKLNGIRFIPIENFYSETRAFLADQLHTTYQVPPDLVDKVKAKHPDLLHQEPYVGTQFIRVNTTRPGLNDPRVRMALSLAIDRKALCETILKGFQPATTLTPAMGEYKPDPVVGFEPERARALLTEAGYPEGKAFPRYSLLIRSAGARVVSEALQAMWKQHLGILVDIESKDFGSYVSAQQSLNFDLAVAGWIGDYLDPSTFLLMWTKDNGNNNTGWFSKEYEDLLNEGAHQADPLRRLEKFRQSEHLLMEAQPLIPYAWQARNYLHRPEVKGWHPLLLDNHPWGAISIEP
ncbi:MAG TPA: peptide ABC transporter substrate-binding protein [Luteolibacter sp.]